MLYVVLDWMDGLAGSQTICTARAPLSGANKDTKDKGFEGKQVNQMLLHTRQILTGRTGPRTQTELSRSFSKSNKAIFLKKRNKISS